MKIVTIVGARPQFVKASAVSREINRVIAEGNPLTEVIVHTGQHFDANMSRIFFDEMGIPQPQYNLGISGGPHGAMTGRMIEQLEEVLESERPDIVLLYGDTNSTLAGAIAASKLDLDIAHVEAGMRSFNRQMPEEINRILTDRVSRMLFCSTDAAMANLENEGIGFWGDDLKAILTGDVMMDSALYYRNRAARPEGLELDGNFVLCTIHRAENTDNMERLREIVSALNEIGSELPVVLPLHPRTRALLEQGEWDTANLTLSPPLGYLNMIWLVDRCNLVLTDSGGLQKEAFFFHKPCITLRDETEWVELTEARFNFLAGAARSSILDTFHNAEFNRNFEIDLYGGGRASERIVSEMIKRGSRRSARE